MEQDINRTAVPGITKVDAAEELLKRRAAQDDLVAFCRYTFPGYVESNVCTTIARKLEEVDRGEILRLIVSIPPRHSKTEHVSRRFPAWFLGRNPQKQVIGTSYSDEKANGNSLAVREIIKDKRYQNLWQRTFTSENIQRWQFSEKINKNPNYLSAGVGGGITGEGADLFIIDDPIKNSEEAESKLIRDKQWEWYTTTARTRLQPHAAIVVTMARWHEDDLVGRLLDLQKKDPVADKWSVLHMKAINDDGEALWPEMYPIEELLKIRASIGEKTFNSLYQGEPKLAEGNVFKREWFKFYKEIPQDITVKVVFWDTAYKARQQNDFSAGVLVGLSKNNYYILDVLYKRYEYPELKKMIQAEYDRDLPAVVLVEDKASGQSIVQELQRETRIPVLPFKVDREKVSRANSVTPLFQARKVYLPDSAPWLYDFMDELCGFPSAAHDDMVDACVGALMYAKNIMTEVAPVVSSFV